MKIVVVFMLLTGSALAVDPLGKFEKMLSDVECSLDAIHDDMASELRATPPSAMPVEWDWRKRVRSFPPVQNQKRSDQGKRTKCGSCWAFATTGAVEASLAIFQPNRPVVRLSTQELVSCVPYSDCGGGNICQALASLRENGVSLNQDRPYEGKDEACRRARPAAQLARWAFVGTQKSFVDRVPPSVNQIKAAILKYGPVVSGIYAGRRSAFGRYTKGVFGLDGQSCKSPKSFFSGSKTDHVVVIVGWGVQHGQTYWIVRNSYGISWGEDGYIRILTDCIAIGRRVAYVVPRADGL